MTVYVLGVKEVQQKMVKKMKNKMLGRFKNSIESGKKVTDS